VFENINWLYPAQRETILESEITDRLAFYSSHLLKNDKLTLAGLSRKLDKAYSMEPGHYFPAPDIKAIAKVSVSRNQNLPP
jgi:hypothetical protein